MRQVDAKDERKSSIQVEELSVVKLSKEHSGFHLRRQE
jgi:hypothetical protein